MRPVFYPIAVAVYALAAAPGAAAEDANMAYAVARESRSPLSLRVKAAYLLNFLRYTTWPADGLDDGPLKMCIGGHDPFGDVLDRTVRDRRVEGRQVEVHRIAEPHGLEACHLLYVSVGERRPAAWLAGASGLPILTVGDAPDFMDLGGMVRLITVEDTIRFGVNLDAARAAGLQVSARILPLAVELVGETP